MTSMIDRRIYYCTQCPQMYYGITPAWNHWHRKEHRGVCTFMSINPDPDKEAGQVSLL